MENEKGLYSDRSPRINSLHVFCLLRASYLRIYLLDYVPAVCGVFAG